MKKFLINILIIGLLIGAAHAYLIFKFDGNTDPYYMKLTDSEANSLVLGGSRASEGIIPTVLDSIFPKDKGIQSFNFAFTNSDSPYGAIYLESIKQKLKSKDEKGIFLLSIHPWNISSLTDNPHDSIELRESELVLSEVTDVTSNPNLQYITKYYGFGWGNTLLKKSENKLFKKLKDKQILKQGKWSFVHDDGWLQVISMMNDSVDLKKYENKSIENYMAAEKTAQYQLSNYRINYLKKTIDYLKKHGEVYLVRFPVNEKIVTFENDRFPKFNGLIGEITKDHEIQYLDYSHASKDYNYSDGNHLVNASSRQFSKDIAQKILKDL
jgi:hypothetical protein